MNTPFRNIHMAAAPAEPMPASAPAPTLPRLREVTNDPATEFANRPGKTKPLPNAIAALILFRKERRKVGRDGIEVNDIKYYSENSITIATKAGAHELKDRMVVVAYNRHDPNIIHVFTDDGIYVESIPAKNLVPFFDAEATERELAAVKRDQARTINRMVELHGADSLDRLAAEKANAIRMHHVVETFDKPAEASSTRDMVPAPDRETMPAVATSRASSAELIQQAEEQANRVAEQAKKHSAAARAINVAEEILKSKRAATPEVDPQIW